jgi:hypothetical protein
MGVTKRRTDRFQAKTDDGRRKVIHEVTEFIEVEGFEGSGELEGIKSYVTHDGMKLNVIGEGVFQDRFTGEVYRRV